MEPGGVPINSFKVAGPVRAFALFVGLPLGIGFITTAGLCVAWNRSSDPGVQTAILFLTVVGFIPLLLSFNALRWRIEEFPNNWFRYRGLLQSKTFQLSEVFEVRRTKWDRSRHLHWYCLSEGDPEDIEEMLERFWILYLAVEDKEGKRLATVGRFVPKSQYIYLVSKFVIEMAENQGFFEKGEYEAPQYKGMEGFREENSFVFRGDWW